MLATEVRPQELTPMVLAPELVGPAQETLSTNPEADVLLSELDHQTFDALTQQLENVPQDTVEALRATPVRKSGSVNEGQRRGYHTR